MAFASKITPSNLRLAALVLGIVSTTILTIHVILLHNKIRPGESATEVTVELSNREHVEQIFLIVSMVSYIVVFVISLWAEIMERNLSSKFVYRLERHLGRDLHDFTDTPMHEVDHHVKRSSERDALKHAQLKQSQNQSQQPPVLAS